MLQIPQKVLKDLATERGVSDLELEVLHLALEGQSAGVIAKKLDIVESTVWSRLRNVYRKFDIVGSSPGKLAVLKRMLEEQYQTHLGELTTPHQYRSKIPDIPVFYGRTQELNQLEKWLLKDGCRLVALLGIGGIGKTTLSIKLAQQVQGQFEEVIWHSLRNAPPVKDILRELLLSLSKQQETALLGNVSNGISRLINYLQQHRYLVILDNVETILKGGDFAGAYREGYQDYGELLRAVGESSHQSCLVITSREKPQEVALLEAKTPLVQSQELKGLDDIAAQNILETVGVFPLEDEEDKCKKLINLYGGNPLALKIISSTIQELYGGKISNFLEEQGESVFLGDIRNLLSQQFERLSDLEKEIMYWLAINRNPVSILELRGDIILPVTQSKLLEALESLRRRSLIEKSEPDASALMLQPVVMEYIIEQLIQKNCEEIKEFRANRRINIFNRYALIKAQAEDYIKESQVRFILQSIIDNLLNFFGNEKTIEDQLKDILSTLPKQSPPKPGYAGGNIINLLRIVKNGLIDECDFSEIAVWQADLKGVNLHNVNFARADLAKSTFSETLSGVLSVAFNSNGKSLATGEVDGKIRLWNVADGKRLWTCRDKEKHASWVRSVAFSPDGAILASGSGDQTVKLWNVDTGKCIKTLKENISPVRSVAFSPDGAILASGSDDGTLRLWKVDTWQYLRTLEGHKSWVWSVAFSPDGAILASGSEDKTVRLWDVRTGYCLNTLKEHDSWVSSVTFSPDGITLASSSEDQTIRLWDVRTGQSLDTLKGHTKWIWSVVFSPDGRTLASGSDDHTIKLWDVDTRQCLVTLEGHTSRIGTIAFSPKSKILASGSEDQTVKFWEIATGQCLSTLKGYTNRVGAVAFKPHTHIIASSSDDKTVKLWNVDTRECIETLKGHANRVGSLAFSPDGKILASGSDDETVKLWEEGTRQCLRTLKEHKNWVSSVAFSPDGKILASGSDDETVKLWNVSTGKCITTLTEHTSRLRSVAFSPDGKTLASGSDDKTVKLWNVDTGQCIKTLKDDNWVWSVTFSPDGKTLASGNDDKTVQLWDVDTGQCIAILKGHAGSLRSVTFSPDGKTLASGSCDQTVKLWNVDTRKCIATLKEHASWVTSVAFSPDGKILASGSDDETIKLWNLQTGECLATLESKKLYENMNITGVIGLYNTQKATLKELGAIEK
jgi:WD40 repeat protein